MNWEDFDNCKSLLTPQDTSELCSSITHVFQNWLISLPQEIIPNILIRLPIKSLIKFSSVSKSWSSTIKNPNFIRTHLTRNRNLNDQNATHLLLLHNDDSYTFHYDNNEFTEHCKVEYPIELKRDVITNMPDIETKSCWRVVGSCNGLCLMVDVLDYDARQCAIWNPSIRRYFLPNLPQVRVKTHGRYDCAIGLGYDAVGDDYKVVRVTSFVSQRNESSLVQHDTTCVQYYSLANDSWGMLRPLPQCIVRSSRVQVLVNGALHWLAIRGADARVGQFFVEHDVEHVEHFVAAFDVGSYLYREIMLPKSFPMEKTLELKLCASGDRKSIGLFVRHKSVNDCYLDIWVMKEYGVEQSWTKLMILTPQGPERSLPEALCFRRRGEVLLVLEGDRELVSLDIGSKQFKKLGIVGGKYCSVDSYEESLFLLEREDAHYHMLSADTKDAYSDFF